MEADSSDYWFKIDRIIDLICSLNDITPLIYLQRHNIKAVVRKAGIIDRIKPVINKDSQINNILWLLKMTNYDIRTVLFIIDCYMLHTKHKSKELIDLIKGLNNMDHNELAVNIIWYYGVATDYIAVKYLIIILLDTYSDIDIPKLIEAVNSDNIRTVMKEVIVDQV